MAWSEITLKQRNDSLDSILCSVGSSDSIRTDTASLAKMEKVELEINPACVIPDLSARIRQRILINDFFPTDHAAVYAVIRIRTVDPRLCSVVLHHCYSFDRLRWETHERRGGAHMGFFERIDTIFN